MLKVPSTATANLGGGGSLFYSYGLTDQFNFLVEGGFGSYVVEPEVEKDKGPAPHQPRALGHLGAGVAYVFDVLSWVPYAGLLANGYVLGGGTRTSTGGAGGVGFALGLDRRIGRSLLIGATFRQHLIFDKDVVYPSLSMVGARIGYVWGW